MRSPGDPFDLGPLPTRFAVDAGLVARLIAGQFPRWAHLPVRAVAAGGWDNWTFHLGAELSVRLPAAAEYALAVEKEHRWLPRLAGWLPFPVPAPVGRGAPTADYPFEWSVHRWIEGRPVSGDVPFDAVRLGLDLADFLAALRRVDPGDGPGPGTHNFFRGGPLRTFAPTVREALAASGGRVDVDLAREVWASASTASWDGVPRWFHGDVAAGNLLLREGRLAAVIDFGTCGVGDPACDLAVAWSLLDVAGRRAFRDRLGVDEAEWTRGRGWALWKALAAHAEDVSARRTLEAVFADVRAG